MDDRPNPSSANVLAVAVVCEGGLGLLALALGWLSDRPGVAQIRLSVSAVALGAAASLPLLAVLVLVTRYPLGPLSKLERVVSELVVPLFENCTWLDFLIIASLAGFGEELLFRGVLQVALSRWISPLAGLLGASVLFGLAHPLSVGYAVLAALYGVYLGILFVWTDNLLVAVVAHAVYDFLALAYLVRRPA